MIVVSLLADMMNFPVDEIATFKISALWTFGKSSDSAKTTAGAFTSFFLVILKTLIVLSTDNDAMKALLKHLHLTVYKRIQ